MVESRTEKDYAIEHGEYLAASAARFQQVINNALQANVEGTEMDRDHVNDSWSALSSAIYEFRKRARTAYRVSPGIDYLAITRDIRA